MSEKRHRHHKPHPSQRPCPVKLDYSELKELSFSKDMLTYPYAQQKKDFEKELAKIIHTQHKRIFLDVKHDTIIIDVTRNRDVGISLTELHKLQEIFEAEEIIVSTPIRCKLHIKFKRKKECKKHTGMHKYI